MTMRSADGTIRQSAHQANPHDYAHERLYAPVVGVILRVHSSDDPFNPSAKVQQDQRGYMTTVDVLVVGHGNDNPWLVPNVVVLPSGASGVDDYQEEIPNGCSQMIDGSQYDPTFSGIDITKVDGDWCVIGFIGGSIEQPVMLSWWPHPGNRSDPATAGFPVSTDNGTQDTGVLKQGRRFFKRYRGTKITITDQGSVFIDTNESNGQVSGSSSGITRSQTDDGGDVQVDMKPARQLQVNFNPSVPLPTDQPSLPQPNPPQGEQTRETSSTTMTLDKDTIALIAGQVVQLITNNKNIEIHAKTKVTIKGDDSSDAVLLGDDDASTCDHVINGETFFDNRYDPLIDWILHHKHPTAWGDTAEPDSPMPFPAHHQSADLSVEVKVKRG